jgi:hypothetical protein
MGRAFGTGFGTAQFRPDRSFRRKLDDQDVARQLPAGSTGLAAIYTEHIKIAHVIRRVILRQTAILNYINPL